MLWFNYGPSNSSYPSGTKGSIFNGISSSAVVIPEKPFTAFKTNVFRIVKKDSLEITDEDREKLKTLIKASDADKIIVTHGTDTMPETAQSLSSIPNKTIVITGAMRPERFTNSDADINLGMAIAAVQVSPPGVYICMHGLVIPHDKIDRNMETGQYKLKE